MKATIKISVVCPAYNSERFIEATLRSVIDQTKAPDEIVVVDDGSTDRTKEIVQSLQSKSSIPLLLIEAGHLGPGAARNRGIQAATCPWVAFIDSDDLWDKGKLEQVVRELESNDEANITCNAEEHVWEDGKKLIVSYGDKYDPGKPLSEQLYFINLFSTSAVVVKRALLTKVGGFDEKMMNAQDYELWLKLSPYLVPIFIANPLGTYTIRQGNITSRGVFKKYRNLFKIAYRYRKYVSLLGLAKKMLRMLASLIKQVIVRIKSV